MICCILRDDPCLWVGCCVKAHVTGVVAGQYSRVAHNSNQSQDPDTDCVESQCQVRVPPSQRQALVLRMLLGLERQPHGWQSHYRHEHAHNDGEHQVWVGAERQKCTHSASMAQKCMYQDIMAQKCMYQDIMAQKCMYQDIMAQKCMYQDIMAQKCTYRVIRILVLQRHYVKK